MKAITHSCTAKSLQGFAVHVLSNDEIELAVIPELGAKIISLKNLRTGREWMWHPSNGLNLFKNSIGDDFSLSPLAGVDECFPTIAPCSWQGRELPDHGEVWSAPWSVDASALESGILKTSIRLEISPFEFQRSIELDGNEIRLSYQLANLDAQEESFLWAIHPLLKLETGDRLELPESTRRLLTHADWLDAVNSIIPENNCAKIFAQPVTEGSAAIYNSVTQDRLEFIWDTNENDTLGLWLTRGGWHGHHHFAIEPANANVDALAAVAANRRKTVAANDSAAWQLRLRVSS